MTRNPTRGDPAAALPCSALLVPVTSNVAENGAIDTSHAGPRNPSGQEQVKPTFERFYADAGEVLLLEIDPSAVGAPLRADAIPTGELFPHLYGPLRLDAVRSAVTMPAAA